MGLYEKAWEASAELKSVASRESFAKWDSAPKQLLDSPDLARKIMGIMLRLTITPEVIQSEVRNYLEDKGVFKNISETFGEYKQHILMALPKAADPQFLDLQNLTSVDQQTIWKYDNREYFQELINLAIQIPFTIEEVDFRAAFATPGAMEAVLAAQREGAIKAFNLQMLNYELDAISRAINTVEMPRQASQDITMTEGVSDYDNITQEAYKELLKIVRALKFNMSHNFSGNYNQAAFPTMQSGEDLIMLIRAPFVNNIGIDLLAPTFNTEYYGFDVETIPVPHFGGLTGFTPAYNAEGQQTEPITDFTQPVDPNEDVVAIITTRRYFVKNTRYPFSITAAPYNARGLYLSSYGNFYGGISCIGYEPFIVIKRPVTP